MAADLPGSPTQAAPDEPHYHNDVLTRTHEPGRAHSSPWMVIVPVVLALIPRGSSEPLGKIAGA